MKRFTFTTATLLIVVFIIGSSGFTGKNSRKVSTQIVYRYDPQGYDPYKKREISCESFLSIDPYDLDDPNNWSLGLPSIVYSSYGYFLRAIIFDEEYTLDGPCDGQLTLQEAIDAVVDYFIDNGCTLPADFGYIRVYDYYCSPSYSDIIIRRSNDNTN